MVVDIVVFCGECLPQNARPIIILYTIALFERLQFRMLLKFLPCTRCVSCHSQLSAPCSCVSRSAGHGMSNPACAPAPTTPPCPRMTSSKAWAITLQLAPSWGFSDSQWDLILDYEERARAVEMTLAHI